MAQLPKPVRAYIGLCAQALDGARELPRRVVELPVVAATTGARATLKLGQQYAELINRGDGVLSRLQGAPEEPPSWATFDDDAEDALAGDDDTDDLEALADDTPPPPAAADRTVPLGAPRGRPPSAFDRAADPVDEDDPVEDDEPVDDEPADDDPAVDVLIAGEPDPEPAAPRPAARPTPRSRTRPATTRRTPRRGPS